MIGYYGWRGAGKTLSLAVEVKKRLKKNSDLIVFTNTPFTFANENFYLWHTIEEVGELCSVLFPMGWQDKEILVIIDEANIVMPARFFNKLPDFFLVFLAESRHINVDIVFTTQHPRRVDVIMRELVEEWVHCERGWFFWWIRQTERVLDSAGNEIDKSFSRFLYRPSRFFSLYDTTYMCYDPSQVPKHTNTAVVEWLSSRLADSPDMPPQGAIVTSADGMGEDEGAGHLVPRRGFKISLRRFKMLIRYIIRKLFSRRKENTV